MMLRIVTVLIGLSPLLGFEMVCRLVGWGNLSELHDPFVGFTQVVPLFILDETGTRYVTSPSRQPFFQPDSFDTQKPPTEFRVFCLGGSSVQGRPYSIETSFTTWLELSLNAADPSHVWQVINCGGVSYASYRLAPILEEVLNYEPDLVVLYTGHNEFLEDRTYQKVKHAARPLTHLHSWTSRLRSYNTLRVALHGSQDAAAPPGAREELSTEVEARLDYRGGLNEYQRDDSWQKNVVSHYRFNLDRMILLAREAGIPIILVNPPSNLKDCPPFKSEVDAALTAAQRNNFTRLWTQAQVTKEPEQRIAILERALSIDPRHAAARFLLAETYALVNRISEAKHAFVRARDEDICPLRMTSRQHDVIRQVAKTSGVPLLDLEHLLALKSPHGILGNNWLLDHVHPSINGHQLIAHALLDKLVTLQLAKPIANWKINQQRHYSSHLDKLTPLYFATGKERLEALLRWTQGRSHRIKP